MQLHRLAGRLPGFHQTESLLPEQCIIGRQGHEHGRRRLGHGRSCHRAVDITDEIRTGRAVLGLNGAQGRNCSGRESQHADAVRVDAPFHSAGLHHGEGRLGIFHRRRNAGAHINRGHVGRRGEHALHVRIKLRFRFRRLHDAILQDKSSHALFGQPVRNRIAFIVHRDELEPRRRAQRSRLRRWPLQDRARPAAGFGWETLRAQRSVPVSVQISVSAKPAPSSS